MLFSIPWRIEPCSEWNAGKQFGKSGAYCFWSHFYIQKVPFGRRFTRRKLVEFVVEFVFSLYSTESSRIKRLCLLRPILEMPSSSTAVTKLSIYRLDRALRLCTMRLISSFRTLYCSFCQLMDRSSTVKNFSTLRSRNCRLANSAHKAKNES